MLLRACNLLDSIRATKNSSRVWKWERLGEKRKYREGIGHFDAKNMRIYTSFLFGCNSSMKGNLARCSPMMRKTEWTRRTRRNRGTGREDARAESSEVHVSQYLSHPKLDFRNSSRWEHGFQTARFAAGLVYWPLACLIRATTPRFISISAVLYYVHTVAIKSTHCSFLQRVSAFMHFLLSSILFRELTVNVLPTGDSDNF